MIRKTVLLLTGAMLFSTTATLAHHPLAAYREGDSQTIRGTMAGLLVRNPHSILYVDAQNKEGATERWTIEWIADLQLQRQGVTRVTLRPGDPLVITGWPAKIPDTRRLWLRTITRPTDGWKWTGSFE